MSKIDLLNPVAKKKVETFIATLEAHGYVYSVLETLRTQLVQDAYFAQGRESYEVICIYRERAGLYKINEIEAKRIITGEKYSMHQSGLAADIVPVINGKVPWDYSRYIELWMAFGILGKEAGLIWGGDWAPLLPCGIGWDPPHYEARGSA